MCADAAPFQYVKIRTLSFVYSPIVMEHLDFFFCQLSLDSVARFFSWGIRFPAGLKIMHLLCCRRTIKTSYKLPVFSSLARVQCKIIELLWFLFLDFLGVCGVNFIISLIVMGFPYFLECILELFSLEMYLFQQDVEMYSCSRCERESDIMMKR